MSLSNLFNRILDENRKNKVKEILFKNNKKGSKSTNTKFWNNDIKNKINETYKNEKKLKIKLKKINQKYSNNNKILSYKLWNTQNINKINNFKIINKSKKMDLNLLKPNFIFEEVNKNRFNNINNLKDKNCYKIYKNIKLKLKIYNKNT